MASTTTATARSTRGASVSPARWTSHARRTSTVTPLRTPAAHPRARARTDHANATPMASRGGRVRTRSLRPARTIARRSASTRTATGRSTAPAIRSVECKAAPTKKGSCKGLHPESAGGTGWGSCTTSPQAQDKCDSGNDDNCNGTPNEGCAHINGSPCGAPDTCNVGIWGGCKGDGTGCSCSGGDGQTKTVWAYDGDGDGYCLLDTTGAHALQAVCPKDNPSPPWKQLGSCTSSAIADCDDTKPAVNPNHAEVCINSLDDNCNGKADEGCACQPNAVDNACATDPSGIPITYPGSVPQGACKFGSRACSADGLSWGPCQGAVAPKPADDCTVAGGVDSSCDGTISCPCTPLGKVQYCTNQTGSCKGSTQSCGAAGWGPCSVAPCGRGHLRPRETTRRATASRNSGCTCINGTSSSCGSCSAGTRTCSGGGWGACNGAPTNIGAACNVHGKAIGACLNGGTWQCNPNSPATPQCNTSNSNIDTGYSSTSAAPNGSYDWNCDNTYEVWVKDYANTVNINSGPYTLLPNASATPNCSGYIGSFEDTQCDLQTGTDNVCNTIKLVHTCGVQEFNFNAQGQNCDIGWSVWHCQWNGSKCVSLAGSYTYSVSACE